MSNKPVLLTRGTENYRDTAALGALGIASVSEAFTKILPGKSEDAEHLLKSAEHANGWLVTTSRNSLTHWTQLVGEERLQQTLLNNANLRFAAIGSGSAQTLIDIGITNIFTPTQTDSEDLLKDLNKFPPADLVLPVGNLARRTLADGLSQAGWQVYSKVVYINQTTAVPTSIIEQIPTGFFSAIVLRSPSSVMALHCLVSNPLIPLICGGPITAQSARELGLEIAGIASDPSPETLAALVSQILKEGAE